MNINMKFKDNLEIKWKSIATVGIWIGMGMGSIFVTNGYLGLVAMITTIFIWWN